MGQSHLFADHALLPSGWAQAVLFTMDEAGFLTGVAPGAAPGDHPRAAGPVIPGMPNLHSHAFQRAMAGLGERVGDGDDSFWTWREVMYGFLARITPEDVQAIAAALYLEMLKSGYTAVGEFHYLHHGPDGTPYDSLGEMSHRIMAAARETGMGLTHLPVLYGYGGFGGQAANPGQRRFLNDPDRFLQLLQDLHPEIAADPQCALGMAPHSLRAVTEDSLNQALTGLAGLVPDAPVHIHIAEQTKEVDDCLAWSGQRPVDWLYQHFEVGPRWCLVHATHMTDGETAQVARSRAVAGLCPTTEANLGDGIFPAPAFLAQNGVWGIGSDSHISVSPIEELRWFEYGHRLISRRRNVLTAELGGSSPSVGAGLYRMALAGGAQALGRPIGSLAPGARADLVVLDLAHRALYGRTGDLLLDALVFAGNDTPVRDVMVGGKWRVREGRHDGEETITRGFQKALDHLLT